MALVESIFKGSFLRNCGSTNAACVIYFYRGVLLIIMMMMSKMMNDKLTHFLSPPLVRPLVLMVDSAKVAHNHLEKAILVFVIILLLLVKESR